MEHKFAFAQVSVLWIARDVFAISNQFVPIAYNSIIALVLPDARSSLKQFIDGFGGKRFPRMKNVRERLALCWLKKHVHVVRHYHKCIQNITVPIKMPQSAHYDFSGI